MQIDSFGLATMHTDVSLFPSADYTLCLDTLASRDSEELYLHTSKPPREGMRAYDLVKALNKVRITVSACVYSGCGLPKS